MEILSPALRLLSSSDSSFSRLLLMVRYHQHAEMLDYVPMQVKMEPFSQLDRYDRVSYVRVLSNILAWY